MVANAGLAKALDKQFASTQTEEMPNHIGLTFRDNTGAICRTFDASALSGIACREGAERRLRNAIAGEGGKTEFRQAGASPVLAAANQMMTSAPFDAAEEKVSLSRGWK